MKTRLPAILLAALWLTACSPETPNPADTTAAPDSGISTDVTTAADTAAPAEIGYALTLTNPAARLIPGAEIDVESILGKPEEKLEAPSCVHDGNDMVYYYDGLELVTTPTESGKNILLSVTLTTESHKTEEGLALGAPLTDAQKLYGDHDTAKSAPDFGRYVFRKSQTSLTLLFSPDNTLTSITYTFEG